MESTPQAVTVPNEPESLEECGLAESSIEHLILKILYYRGDLYGQDLSIAIGLKFSVIQGIVDNLKLRYHVQVKRSMGVGDVGAYLSLTEAGRSRARECLEQNQYSGVAPVPLEQYSELVRRQRPPAGWLTKQALRKALKGMVLTERTLAQVGPAVSSANSLLIYGKPGDGKTYLIESLNNLDAPPVFVPHAIECQGNIIQVFDPIYHQRIDEEQSSVLTVATERSYDRRWVKCRRPFIVTGGELTTDMLDLRFNATSGIYEAPFQMKANNGAYLIDDFGRQRATPAEVLNRWIVPMERRVDYLSFMSGGKMTAPFEAFLVFSTNLNPADLGDEAFLRRIQYKMLLRGPSESEFTRIFEGYCATRRITCPEGLVERLLQKYYRRTKRPMRRCQPRDVLHHALNLINFEKLPEQLNDDVMDRAFASCFLEEENDGAPSDSAILPSPVQSASDHWGDRLARIPTVFGSLAFLASLRDSGGAYREVESEREFGEAETQRTLSKLHSRAFADWSRLDAEQQNRDLTCYFSENHAPVSEQARAGWFLTLIPPSATREERQLLAQRLDSLPSGIVIKPESEIPIEAAPEPARLQRIA